MPRSRYCMKAHEFESEFDDDAWHSRCKLTRMNGYEAEARHLSELVKLRRARDRIDREYALPLNVEELARGVNMSAGHLSRQFRLAYGESPYSYLMTRRIERAKTLLRAGNLGVTETCFTVGFSSLGTFSTRFSALVGVAPSVYRNRYAGEADGLPACIAKRVTRPVRNQEAPDGQVSYTPAHEHNDPQQFPAADRP